MRTQEYVVPTLQEGKKSLNSPVPTVFPWSKPVKCRPSPPVCHPLPLKKPKQAESPSSGSVNEIEQHKEKIVELQSKVLKLEEEIRTLESQRFFFRRFQGSDKDIQFYAVTKTYNSMLAFLPTPF